MNYIAPDHRRKLQESGLNAATIQTAGLYTEVDPERLGHLLRRPTNNAPALVFPYFDFKGKPTDYAVARPSTPRESGSKLVKYEVPTGRGNRSYFPKQALAAIRTPRRRVLITEGILKALCATQASAPCIGLMGVWNWQYRRSDKAEPRQLIDDLRQVDWQLRSILIVFDFDAARNSSVNQAASELARVLAEAGAKSRILQLPPGPSDLNGNPTKQGLDDFIVRVGEQHFREWLDQQVSEPKEQSLDDWRAQMIASRRESIDKPGTFLDRSPTGAGKSHVDGTVLAFLEDHNSLSLQPTHINCSQVEADLNSRGIAAASFPPLNDSTCQKIDEVESIQATGLVFQRVLCPECEYADECDYKAQYEAAKSAQHAIATHKRGVVQMPDLVKGRTFISVHENPLAMLRPMYSATKGFEVIALIADRAGSSQNDSKERAYFTRMANTAANLKKSCAWRIRPSPCNCRRQRRNPRRTLIWNCTTQWRNLVSGPSLNPCN